MALHSMKDPETTVGHQSKQLETKLLGIEKNLETTVDTKQVSKQWHTVLHEGPSDNSWPSVKTARDQAAGYPGEP